MTPNEIRTTLLSQKQRVADAIQGWMVASCSPDNELTAPTTSSQPRLEQLLAHGADALCCKPFMAYRAWMEPSGGG